MIKYYDQRQLKEAFISTCASRGLDVHKSEEGSAAGCMSSELAGHMSTALRKQRA